MCSSAVLLLIARPCPGCGDTNWYVCPSCLDALEPAPAISVPGAASASGVIRYEGTARSLVLEGKEPHGRHMLRWWADALAVVAPDDIDLVTWIPASRSGRRLRGYDHGRVLAGAVARRLGRRSARTLRRVDNRAQRGAGRDSRSEVDMCSTRRQHKKRLLLVDDVHTTGASCRIAVTQLIESGASRVDIRVMAVVPDLTRMSRRRAYSDRIGQTPGGASWT
ncbi:MAG: ComF family protein [Actinomycetia bacterium]|nr:ComF family protein [Actinomycetes bacterium]MCP4957845.1 ComF family protein [Actinomycetes bacterium]